MKPDGCDSGQCSSAAELPFARRRQTNRDIYAPCCSATTAVMRPNLCCSTTKLANASKWMEWKVEAIVSIRVDGCACIARPCEGSQARMAPRVQQFVAEVFAQIFNLANPPPPLQYPKFAYLQSETRVPR